MSRTLSTLQRVRDIQERGCALRLQAAQRAADAQALRITEMEAHVARSHQGEVSSAFDLQQAAAWRLRRQLQLRGERERLAGQHSVVGEAQDAMWHARRQTRVVELAMERHAEAAALEDRRAETRQQDEVAGQRWWRRCA